MRKRGLDFIKTHISSMLLLTSSRHELLYVRDEIAGINQHLQIKDMIDQATSEVLMNADIEQGRVIDM